MKAYKLYCAANTESNPIALGYSKTQLERLPLATQIADRQKVFNIPDTARTPTIGVARVALNLGTIGVPDWKICSLPIKTHSQQLYVEVEQVEHLCVAKLEEKLKTTVKVHAEIARLNML